MGPRPRGRGVFAPRRGPLWDGHELQWGRARAGAEFPLLLCPSAPLPIPLQWGRARAGAELAWSSPRCSWP